MIKEIITDMNNINHNFSASYFYFFYGQSS